jgi:outer membrane murein-binding lipoprotein Lpp
MMKKGMIALSVLAVIVGGLSMGCIDEEEVNTEIDDMQAQIDKLEQQIADIKDKALERAEDFADNLSLVEDITDITVKYDGREREWMGNNSYCHITYYYNVSWIENEYETELISVYGVDAWLDYMKE